MIPEWSLVFLGVVLTAAALVSWMQGWTRPYWMAAGAVYTLSALVVEVFVA